MKTAAVKTSTKHLKQRYSYLISKFYKFQHLQGIFRNFPYHALVKKIIKSRVNFAWIFVNRWTTGFFCPLLWAMLFCLQWRRRLAGFICFVFFSKMEKYSGASIRRMWSYTRSDKPQKEKTIIISSSSSSSSYSSILTVNCQNQLIATSTDQLTELIHQIIKSNQ